MFEKEVSSFPILGFGTSKLGHHGDQRSAINNLNLAYESGIRYFDTAPIYGYGWSEKLLGKFVRDKRSEVMVATKIGLQPSCILSSMPYSMLSRIRRIAKVFASPDSKAMPMGVQEYNSMTINHHHANFSLDQSLRRLKTDYVDVLLLHEATVPFANAPETKKFIEDILRSGKARVVGVGSAIHKLKPFNDLDTVYRVLQHEFSLLDQEVFAGQNPMHSIHGLLKNMKYVIEVAKNKNLRNETLKKWNVDIDQKMDVLHLCLAAASYVNPGGITIFSATRREHIGETIAAWHSIRIDAEQYNGAIIDIKKHFGHK